MNGWRIYVACCLVLQCSLAVSTQAQQSESAHRLGFQKRHGDEIMVCGQLYRIGTPVKLWLDPGGFDAYRTTRHFSPFEKREWYARDDQGVFLTFPPKIRGVDRFADRKLRPRRSEMLTGKLGDTTYRQYDYTGEQYAALIKLTAALSDIFPQIRLDVPRQADGTRIERTLSDEQWASFSGIMGHYHVQGNKSDPGPAMDWEYLLENARNHRAEVLAKP